MIPEVHLKDQYFPLLEGRIYIRLAQVTGIPGLGEEAEVREPKLPRDFPHLLD